LENDPFFIRGEENIPSGICRENARHHAEAMAGEFIAVQPNPLPQHTPSSGHLIAVQEIFVKNAIRQTL
jgi:hypothetical protein